MVETEIRHSMGQQSGIDTSSCFSPATGSTSKACTDELQFLDYLSADFSYLRRFILASNQMVRLLQAETARASAEIQAKLVNNIEIAKETLLEAGASARPFVACPGHLLHYRQAYYNMLSAARSLVPHMKDADVKLRLRRLILPLTSTSQFRVSIPVDQSKAIEKTPLPTWWDCKSTTLKAGPLGTSPLRSAPSRRRMRRSSASAVVKFASSPMSYSSLSSDSPLNPSSGKLASTPKRLRPSPYPSSSPSSNEDAEPLRSEEKDTEVAVPSTPPSDASASSPASQLDQPQTQSDQPPSPPISYLSPQTRKHLSLLEQQQRELSAGYAYRKNLQVTSSDAESLPVWDWNTPIRPSLGGIDCNLPHLKGPPGSTPAQPGSALAAISSPSNEPTVYSSLEDEYREADENFRKGLGWAPLLKRSWVGTGGVPEPSEGLTWCTSWDDGTGVRSHPSELVTTMLATFPGEPITQKPLAESTCIVM